FAKKYTFAARIVAIQVVFRNDSDDSMKVNLERIRLNITLSEEDHQALYPLSSEEAADVITHPGSKNVTMKRLPIPLGGPKVGHDKKWVEVEKSLNDAGVIQALLHFQDRKSTRLNSSHQINSYAVFCLKKKKQALARKTI